uniref:Rano class II histocompatibility antigen, A beta chain-like n=1 Tax=Haplochromis burtoni TaxID=8153 RepID=A0A3Q3BZB4_HAPBU
MCLLFFIHSLQLSILRNHMNRSPHFEDMEYTRIISLNKIAVLEYNHTRGSWIGFTPYTIELAKFWNLNPFGTREAKALCLNNLGYIQILSNVTYIPTIRVKSVKQYSGGHPAMLVCSAFNFYPKQIRMTWLRNQKEVTTGVSYSEVMPDGDWYYQIHSYLEYTPTHGEKITCVVEHLSISEPILAIWDPTLPVAARNKIIVGTCGLLLGFVIVSCGFIYHKKKSSVYNAFCQGKGIY